MKRLSWLRMGTTVGAEARIRRTSADQSATVGNDFSWACDLEAVVSSDPRHGALKLAGRAKNNRVLMKFLEADFAEWA